MEPSRENRERSAKACKALKPFGISAETITSALKRLLGAYEIDWTYIEEDDYRVLIEAIFGTGEEAAAEPPKKEAPLESQTGTSLPCSINSASEVQQTAETDIETINIVEDDKFEIPLAVIHPAPRRDSCDDDSWLKRKRSADLEDENLDGKEKENEIDIACSCNGEVKLSFCICKPPEGFCVPSVDAVIKQVDDMYGEKFKDLGTQFSLSEILKDICESLVEEGDF